MTFDYAGTVVAWQKIHGRHELPWQNTRDPYRVWLSEIMLQQTQVTTVLDYFKRFLQRFPDVRSLAQAKLDDVLALWSGLGYYSRARNLHACAGQVLSLYGGQFPRTVKQLQSLPGIGRSTAGAIASLCFGERVAILDGNVKRVLTRVLGFELDLARTVHEKALWDQAEELLPRTDLHRTMPAYTQGMMDLGATVCLSRKPLCQECPLSANCKALAQDAVLKYPVKTRSLKRSAQSLWLLFAKTPDHAVWLNQRPTPGVWAGLYCFEIFEQRGALEASLPARYRSCLQDQPPVKHVLTHKDLYLHVVKVELPASSMKERAGGWFRQESWSELGLPAPIRKILGAA